MKLFGTLVGAAFGLAWLCLSLASFGLTVYGLILCFKASIVLGVLACMVQPSPLIIGLVALLGRPDVARALAHWLGL